MVLPNGFEGWPHRSETRSVQQSSDSFTRILLQSWLMCHLEAREPRGYTRPRSRGTHTPSAIAATTESRTESGSGRSARPRTASALRLAFEPSRAASARAACRRSRRPRWRPTRSQEPRLLRSAPRATAEGRPSARRACRRPTPCPALPALWRRSTRRRPCSRAFRSTCNRRSSRQGPSAVRRRRPRRAAAVVCPIWHD